MKGVSCLGCPFTGGYLPKGVPGVKFPRRIASGIQIKMLVVMMLADSTDGTKW